MERLRGKVALVTGGASGIGEATVRLFVDEGASMVLADLQDERGRSVAKDAGPRAVYVHADVSREADVAAMVDETVRRFGRLDCLFNNAGFAGVHGPIDEIGVAMPPGQMQLTRTPRSPSSMATERVRWMTAALAAL